MEAIQKLLNDVLNKEFVQAILSNPRKKDGVLKIKVRPVEMRGKRIYQLESFTKTQAFHENLETEQAAERILSYMEEFRQMQLDSGNMEYTVLVSKKGKVTIQKHQAKGGKKQADLSHNRSKKYILKEGIPVPFLQDLGVMTQDGKIVRTKFDKFRQINRFLEFIEDILPRLDQKREVTILDFGCGKSYLTFAMYYYLHELQNYDVRIIGLDLKKEVIRHCSELAVKYGYEKLTFLEGDIADYDGVDKVDMVVTLHACDTATDHALAKAVAWKAGVILSVPCCQHELNGQIRNDTLSPVLSYGILKERMAALITDGLRAQLLEEKGYHTQILEFVDMEHTPKNLLIRAVYTGKRKENREQTEKCMRELHLQPTLQRLLEGMEGGADEESSY